MAAARCRARRRGNVASWAPNLAPTKLAFASPRELGVSAAPFALGSTGDGTPRLDDAGFEFGDPTAKFRGRMIVILLIVVCPMLAARRKRSVISRRASTWCVVCVFSIDSTSARVMSWITI